MTDLLDHLKAALADPRALEREFGRGRHWVGSTRIPEGDNVISRGLA